ncbi:MAG: M28 family metallopeptidase [Candidatus Xenobia bacterium]
MTFDGKRAWQHVAALTALGNRAPGSAGHEAAVQYLTAALSGWEVRADRFRAGPLMHAQDMTNVVARGGPPRLVLGTHYDTIVLKRAEFVGANDGGSGCGVLLELARVVPESMALELVFVDGEEALAGEADGVGLYGSRRYVRHAPPDLRAAIIIDMVGDPQLRLCDEQHSTPWLRELVREGLNGPPLALLDDHIPFVEANIPALLLADFGDGRGPGDGTYWHTERDTLEQVSPDSLQRVGDLLLDLLSHLVGVGEGSQEDDSASV